MNNTMVQKMQAELTRLQGEQVKAQAELRQVEQRMSYLQTALGNFAGAIAVLQHLLNADQQTIVTDNTHIPLVENSVE